MGYEHYILISNNAKTKGSLFFLLLTTEQLDQLFCLGSLFFFQRGLQTLSPPSRLQFGSAWDPVHWDNSVTGIFENNDMETG